MYLISNFTFLNLIKSNPTYYETTVCYFIRLVSCAVCKWTGFAGCLGRTYFT